ncbi:MAG: hypothetical protein K8F33_10735 [Thermomonas sp.]|nr:hypothetical protein [Thermomonas sp.]MBZ0088553.1 hypothetical protein [Thermomonas sp.]
MTAKRKNPHGLGAGLRKLLGWARFEYISDVLFVVAVLYLAAEAAWLVLR